MTKWETEVLRVADRWNAAMASGDPKAVLVLFREGAGIWHNYDMVITPMSEKYAAALVGMHLRFEEIHRYVVSDGCIQQCIARRELQDGTTVEMPIADRMVISDGLITHMDGYLDTGQVPRFYGLPPEALKSIVTFNARPN
jgi:hypothetical protein